MKRWLMATSLLLLASCGTTSRSTPGAPAAATTTESALPVQASRTPNCPAPDVSGVRAVRFDPSFYYGSGLSAAQLSELLVTRWAANGVNTVYFLAYNPTYGARYRTSYAGNVMEDWGRLDLLGAMLIAAAQHHLQVVAWLYDFRHGGAIAQHPDWASLDKAGAPYVAGDDKQFLSLASSSAENWYQGFIKDLLTRYPALSGVDLAEPVVNWWGTDADHSATMNAAFASRYPGKAVGGAEWRTFRSSLLSEHLQNTIRTVHGLCKSVHLTMTLTPDAQGNLLSSATLASETGFDLSGLLNSADKPDLLNAEMMWQQWRASYGAGVFNVDWTRTATAQAKQLVAGRSRLAVHVETTDFGGVRPRAGELEQALQAALAGGADGLDVYHTERIDAQQAWPEVQAVYLATP